MNVTKSNFDAAFAELSAHIGSAEFIAIDEEMTGIRWCGPIGSTFVPYGDSWRQQDGAEWTAAANASAVNCVHTLDDLPGLRYAKMRTVASTYAIIQFGLALFTKQPDGSYHIRAFN
jgi:hypothetical protein